MAYLLLQTVIYIQQNSTEGKCFLSYLALFCDQNEKLWAWIFLTSSISLLYMLAGVGGVLLKSITHFVLAVIREGIHWALSNSKSQGWKKEFTSSGRSVQTLTLFPSRKCIISKIFYNVFLDREVQEVYSSLTPATTDTDLYDDWSLPLTPLLQVIWLHMESHFFSRLDCMQTPHGTLRPPMETMPSGSLVQV